LRSVRLRYFNACGCEPGSGLGERHEPETHLIPLVFRAIRTGKPVTVFGDDYATPDGTCIRDYIHVSDLADAHILAVEYLLSGGGSDMFNLGTGRGHSVREVLASVERATGVSVPHEIGARREGDPANLVADADKVRQKLGWQARSVNLDSAVQDAWRFVTCQSTSAPRICR
jgi:UDP-glucose 4-epimerase